MHRYSEDEAQAERILANRFYRNIAGALSGTQEYMAAEKLYELHESGEYDLVVVDTPPTRHALDFLDAPARLTRMLDNRIFRFLMMPTRAYLRAAGFAVQGFLRAAGRTVGTEVVDDVVAFFRAFEGMEQGFRQRAVAVTELLGEPDTAFVLVTTPRRDAVDEAEFFADRLRESDAPGRGAGREPGAPRVRRRAGRRLGPSERGRSACPRSRPQPALVSRRATRNLADYSALARRERDALARAGDRIGTDSVAYLPSLAHDIVDFTSLEVGRGLAPGIRPGARTTHRVSCRRDDDPRGGRRRLGA